MASQSKSKEPKRERICLLTFRLCLILKVVKRSSHYAPWMASVAQCSILVCSPLIPGTRKKSKTSEDKVFTFLRCSYFVSGYSFMTLFD